MLQYLSLKKLRSVNSTRLQKKKNQTVNSADNNLFVLISMNHLNYNCTMNMTQYKKYISLLFIGLFVAAIAFSQDTTGKKRTIDITSSFKPVLREAVKINFNAASPVVDS